MEAFKVSPVVTPIRRLQTGFGVHNDIHWQMYNIIPITAEEARTAQRNEGYDPMGYGFYGFQCVEDNPGLYTATWHCYASAD